MKVEFWRFGGTPVPATEIANIARRFEAQGWDGFVVGQDIGVLPDSYLVLALAAAATTKLKVGTGVSVPLRNTMDVATAIRAQAPIIPISVVGSLGSPTVIDDTMPDRVSDIWGQAGETGRGTASL